MAKISDKMIRAKEKIVSGERIENIKRVTPIPAKRR